MKLLWHTITVQQMQEAEALASIYAKDNGSDPLERSGRIAAILFNTTFEKCEAMSVKDHLLMLDQCENILKSEPTGKPLRKIKIGKNRYRAIYDYRKLTIGQRRRLQQIEDTLQNLHLRLECLVYKTTWYGKRIYGRKADVIAKDLLQARFIDAYHVCKFYNKVGEEIEKELQLIHGGNYE